ncbi:cytochrome P450 2K1-like [Mantella aurantiaca]
MTFLMYFFSRTDYLLYLITCFVFFYYWINGSKKSNGKMPPGPRPLPIIGNLHLLNLRKPHDSLMKLSEKYGEIFTFHFGSKKLVVISGYRAVKDALVNQADDFGERGNMPFIKLMNTDKDKLLVPVLTLALGQLPAFCLLDHGIMFANGESWKAMKRFTLSTIREFLMGNKTMETSIQEELISVIEYFKSHNGKPFDASLIMECAMSNVICSLIFGEKFDYSDQRFKKIVRLANEFGKLPGTPKLLLYNVFPLISTILGAHKQIMQIVNDLREFVLQRINHQRQEFNTNVISGYTDAYLMKQEQESTKAETFFDDENIVYSVMNLLESGSDITSATLRWGILLMMKYPEIQKKVQEEIEAQMKQGQLPKADDRRNMPYTEAVVHEIQRFANILPLNISHKTSSDVYFRGYCIPKGIEVIPFLTSVLYDKTQWNTPYQFNPNHFLDEAGKFIKRDAFMPFSAGRRACAGESLARMELFLFFTGLLKTFTFHPPPGVSREDISLNPDIGFVQCPLPHLVCAKLNY